MVEWKNRNERCTWRDLVAEAKFSFVTCYQVKINNELTILFAFGIQPSTVSVHVHVVPHKAVTLLHDNALTIVLLLARLTSDSHGKAPP